jgi:ParB family chromosome partitioning protein
MGAMSHAEAMREKRAESLGRNPRAFEAVGLPGADEKKFEGRRKHPGAYRIALDRIHPDQNQPRTEFDEAALERLAASLKARGQLQPIRVRWDEGRGSYVIVVGERRWRAATMAGLDALDCIVVDGEATPDDLLEDQLVENALREDLKPVEQARSYRALMDARGYTHRDLAERLNVAHTTVTRALGLLDLPEIVQARVDADEIKPSTAYAIASGIDDPDAQIEVADRVASEGLSRGEANEVIRQLAERKTRAGGPKAKGRGAKPKLVKSRVFKTESGIKITAERAKGIDPASLVGALQEALDKAKAEMGQGG